MKFIHLLFFSLAILVAGCGHQSINSEPQAVNIFNQDSLYSYNILVHQDSLAIIDSNPAAEKYIPVQLVFGGDTIHNCKLRYKGSRGAFAYCLSGKDWKNPSGYKTCNKLSMKLKLKDDFHGVKKLQFHSQNHDKSQMRERLGYYLFNKMGVPASRSVHSKVYINNEYIGVFALTEQINKEFVKRKFEEKNGNLYKETWPLFFNGTPRPVASFLKGLKTNKKANQDTLLIADFAKAIVDTSHSFELENWMNINEIMAFAVVDRIIRADDGPFHWYCNNGMCNNHNFFWYEEPKSKQLHLIPWDLDNAFENIASDKNPVTPIADQWGEIQNNCQPFPYAALQIGQMSAACDPLTAELVQRETEFKELRDQLFKTVLSNQHLDSLLNCWSFQIESATKEAKESHPDAVSVEEWKKELNILKDALTNGNPE